MTATKQVLSEHFCFASSIKKNVWHPKTAPKAYEWFYFDALSDNGREALVITFFDNFIFSPRYNSHQTEKKVPALMFCYYRDGKPIYRAVNEFSENELPRQIELVSREIDLFKDQLISYLGESRNM